MKQQMKKGLKTKHKGESMDKNNPVSAQDKHCLLIIMFLFTVLYLVLKIYLVWGG